MKSQYLLQVDMELEMAGSAHDLKIIEMAMKNADTDAKKVRSFFGMRLEFVYHFVYLFIHSSIQILIKFMLYCRKERTVLWTTI
jgi:hypothetical protein